ncbi:two-component sensor histidine kinase [Oceanidesulfovibrio marinus]|uniref:histidine kinase n=1 Tax=Oceanidesulfovibrio marinus TaxID=370038 RepID=A0A6P1ZBL6_9BACT|nr:two-component sensor histidine kinase [Oceanidesulfovibrio marinus]TVM30991.1 two-component sensor histidine kinase [Oceanidesulfovibrio marinus]
MECSFVTTPSLSSTLSKKISLLIIFVSLTPLIVVGGVFAHLFHTAYRGKTIAHLEELVSKHRDIVDSHLAERLASIKTLMDACPLEDLRRNDFLKELLYTLHTQYGRVFVDIGLVNDAGSLEAYAGPFQLGNAQYAKAEWFKKAMENDHFISDMFMGIRNQPHFIVAASREWGGRRYILRATVDFEAFTRLVENIRIGETGHAFIVNRAGDFQTQPRSDFSQCKELLLELMRESLPADHAVGPTLVFTEGHSCETNADAVYVLATLKQGDWVMIYEQIAADAFRDLYQARLIVLSVLALGSLGIIVTAILLTRRVVAYIAKLDADKEKMNEQVVHASKMASLGEMAAGIAHEINNPVAVMVEEAGWIQDILEDAPEGEPGDVQEIQRAVNQIRTQGNRCKDITQKLLSFARKTEPERCALDVNSLILETVELVASKARYANVHIETRLSPLPPHIQASVTEMQQILLNLINNSLDAMEETGGKLSIASRTLDSVVEIEIRDTGPGIPESVLPKIFDPFFTTKPVGRGTGLGLAVCYGLIKNMNGDITVNSAVGQGAEFRIRIPRTPESAVSSFSLNQPKGGTR